MAKRKPKPTSPTEQPPPMSDAQGVLDAIDRLNPSVTLLGGEFFPVASPGATGAAVREGMLWFFDMLERGRRARQAKPAQDGRKATAAAARARQVERLKPDVRRLIRQRGASDHMMSKILEVDRGLVREVRESLGISRADVKRIRAEL